MLERPIDWQKAVALICDIARGSAAISLRLYARHPDPGIIRAEIAGWDHHQIQAHGLNDHKVSRLFSLEHLNRVLSGISDIKEEFFAYEVDATLTYEEDAKILLVENADIVVTTVNLTVGDAKISWFLVSLSMGRDTVYWKMKYEGRSYRPHLSSLASE